MIIILFIVFFAILFVLAFFADKRKDKFIAELWSGKSIHTSADSVRYYTPGNVIATTGILYITAKNLVFMKYKYKVLGFIPFFGSLLEALFIDEEPVFDLPLSKIKIYEGQKTVYVTTTQRNVRASDFAVTIFTKDNIEYKLNIPMVNSTIEKPEILAFLDVLMLEE